MKIKAFAKINLFLDVLNKRRDGYHNINSLLTTISLFDIITLTSRPKDISVSIPQSCRFPGLPWEFSMGRDADNLITRAVRLLKKHTGCDKGAAISLVKRIPIGAGLGGGSADAAAVLTGLNRLWKTGLTGQQLEELSAQIGCDVPALVHGGTVRMEGRGEIITPLKPELKKELWGLLIYPGFAISTTDVYHRLDRHPDRTGRSFPAAIDRKFRLILSGLETGNRTDIAGGLFNAFQKTVFEKYPFLEMIKNYLEKLGAKHVLLTGSGSTVFVLLKDRKEGLTMAEELGRRIGSPLWTKVFHAIGMTKRDKTICA